jgi:hypothetical protein
VEQTKTVFGYAKAFITASPVLAKEIDEITTTEIRLKNGVIIATHASSFRTVRGPTLLGCVLDEVAYFRDETSAMPDVETYRAVLPALATTNGMLVAISTPYRKAGLLHAKHRDFFGRDDPDTLVVSGGTQLFNPAISAATINAQRAADPEAAGAEWDAEFRRDLAAFLDDQTIDAAVDYGRPLELPPRPDQHYRAFCDASGGRSDHYVVAVGHRQDGRFTLDAVVGKAPPFDPGWTTQELANVVKRYACHEVTGDNYSAEWVQRAWAHNDVRYVVSELNRSELYLEALPLFTQGLVSLPNHPTLLRELRLLERRTHRSGRDTIDHGRNGTDDYANAACGCLRLLTARRGFLDLTGWQSDDAPAQPPLQWQHPADAAQLALLARVMRPPPLLPRDMEGNSHADH